MITSGNEWYKEWQWMRASDNEWQQLTTNDNEWQWMTMSEIINENEGEQAK